MRSSTAPAILRYVLVSAAIIGCAHHDAPLASPPVDSTLGVCIEFRVTPGTATLHVSDTTRFAVLACNVAAWRWHMSDTAIATVDSMSGLVRAKAIGLATVIAREVADPTVAGAAIVNVVP